MEKYSSPNDAIEQLIKKIGPKIVVAAPLGAGKANHLLNSLYLKAKQNPNISLKILTALTLQKPKGKSDLEKRFLDPFAERVFGNYPNLLFEEDRIKEALPKNIEVVEFYFRAGQFKNNEYAQRNYLSSNYTHVVRDAFDFGVNVICQQVCKGEIDSEEVYSLSCNSDTSKDLFEKLKASGRKFATIAQVNQDLPFMYGEAIVGQDFVDILVDNRDLDFPIFAPPKMSVSDADFMIGLHSSSLIKDDGEIQIGIGSLGDALVYALGLRQKENQKYCEILSTLEINSDYFPAIKHIGSLSQFEKGLFAATEMLVDSFSELYKKNILKKKVYDSIIIQRLLNDGKIQECFDTDILEVLHEHKAIDLELREDDFNFLIDFGIILSGLKWQNGSIIYENGQSARANILELDLSKTLGSHLRNGAIAHGGFFLGPRAFYNFLKDLPIAERKLFRMKRISQINQLYGHEEIDRLQRLNGRFINTCMKVTLNGSACSDALEDNAQISGVGGQYNFVAMAHELPDARSILQLRSTRLNASGKLESNIVFNYGNCTIPRHLRDMVITEYGIADLRGKTDEEVAISLIQIADSRFQKQLIKQAKEAQKLDPNFQLLKRFKNNFPKRYQNILKNFKQQDLFPAFPLGTDFTDQEIELGRALKKIKALMQSKIKFLYFIILSFVGSNKTEHSNRLMKRMGLESPRNFKEKLYQKLLYKMLREK